MFADSSQYVFFAVGFFHDWIIETEKLKLRLFLVNKSSTIEALSSQKLELQVALLVSSLKEDILRGLSIDVDRTFLWTDSTTVLQWLH